MKKTLFLLTLLAIMIMSSTAFAIGDVIFSREFDVNSTNAYSSIYTYGQMYYQSFADFYYDGSFTMTDFHWWGGAYDPCDISGFTFQIWSESPTGSMMPDILLYDEYFAGDANAQYFGYIPGVDVYKYGIDLSTPFAPLATGNYWFSVYAHATTTNWFWALGNGIDFNQDWQYDYSGDSWSHPVDGDFAFEITGTNVIPEPGTLILLGLGLMGLAARRFKK